MGLHGGQFTQLSGPHLTYRHQKPKTPQNPSLRYKPFHPNDPQRRKVVQNRKDKFFFKLSNYPKTPGFDQKLSPFLPEKEEGFSPWVPISVWFFPGKDL